MKQELIVIGGGEHAGVLIDAAMAQPETWNVIGFVDQMPCEETVLRFKINKLGSDEDLDAILNYHPNAKLVIGVGDVSRRNKIISSLFFSEDRWANLIHPSAIIASNVRLSYGIVVMSKAIIQTGSQVSEHAIVNNGVVIDDTTHSLVQGQQQLALNFEVPAGTDMQLGISNGNTGLYRNDAGANYPYDIGSIMSITGNSADPDYYYFYYDIELEVPCENTSTAIFDKENNSKKIINITDVLGRKTTPNSKQTLFYLFDDGTVEKHFIIE